MTDLPLPGWRPSDEPTKDTILQAEVSTPVCLTIVIAVLLQPRANHPGTLRPLKTPQTNRLSVKNLKRACTSAGCAPQIQKDRVRGACGRGTRCASRKKDKHCVVSVACDAEKSSWDADLFAEDAAGQKMRCNSRVWGRKIRNRIVTVAFDAERFPCDAESRTRRRRPGD